MRERVLMRAEQRAGSTWARYGEFIFPAVVFALAMLFHGADLGKYLDDWMLCRRDFQTLEVQRLTDLNHPGFYRPLSRIVSPIVQTVLWEYDRLIHLLLIAAHAANALLVWRLLVAVGCERRTAIAGAMFFALYPVPHEAMFWSSIIATNLATAGFTLMALVQVWIARRASKPWDWWAVPLMAALAFATCCLNEQPAMGILALPALSLAVSSQTRGASRVRRWTTAIVPGFVSGLAVLLYLWLLVSTAPAGERASAGQWTPREELAGKALRLVHRVVDQAIMSDFVPAALSMGWRSLRESPWLSIAFAVALIFAAVLFVRWWMRDQPTQRDQAPFPNDRPAFTAVYPHPTWAWQLWLAMFGLGVFFLAFVPALVVSVYTADSRMFYSASLGLVAIGTACADRAGASSRPRLRAAGAGVVVTISIVFALMLVGLQRSYRERAAWESRQAAALLAMIPDPPERAVFVVMSAPLATRTLPPTHSREFDTAVIAIWENPWCLNWFVRWHYRRPDLRALPSLGWPGPAVVDITPGGLRTTRNPWNPGAWRADAVAEGGHRVAWRLLIPILIEDDGRLSIVTRIIVRDGRSGDELFRIEPPLVKAMRDASEQAAQRIGEREFVFERPTSSSPAPTPAP